MGLNINDSKNLLSYLTFRRILNLFVLKTGYLFSRFIKRPVKWGLPYSLSIEPTTACNLGCPECPSGLKQFTRPTGKISLDLNRKILEQTAKTVFYINYYFQGEPFLHPDFLEIIRDAKNKRIYTSTSTNAHFINTEKAKEIVNSGLDRLIISIDGLTQKTYENYRVNGKLEKVIDGAKNMVVAKKELHSKTPHLIFQFLVVRQNEHEVNSVFNLARELGIDEVRIKTAQLYDYQDGNVLMPENEKYSRYKLKSDGKFHLKYKTANHCWRMWSSCVLTWDGKVVPCCFDKDAKYVLGSLTQNDFKKIWQAPEYVKFRKTILLSRSEIDICRNCSEGAKVWA